MPSGKYQFFVSPLLPFGGQILVLPFDSTCMKQGVRQTCLEKWGTTDKLKLCDEFNKEFIIIQAIFSFDTNHMTNWRWRIHEQRGSTIPIMSYRLSTATHNDALLSLNLELIPEQQTKQRVGWLPFVWLRFSWPSCSQPTSCRPLPSPRHASHTSGERWNTKTKRTSLY